jgi:hypothetical protein
MPPLPWRTKTQPDPDRTYLVMASRLPLRSRRTVPRFLRLTLSVVRQLERTDGLVGYTLLAQPMKKTFWTLSAWTDQQHLDAFARAMPRACPTWPSSASSAQGWARPASPSGRSRGRPCPSPGMRPSNVSWAPRRPRDRARHERREHPSSGPAPSGSPWSGRGRSRGPWGGRHRRRGDRPAGHRPSHHPPPQDRGAGGEPPARP